VVCPGPMKERKKKGTYGILLEGVKGTVMLFKKEEKKASVGGSLERKRNLPHRNEGEKGRAYSSLGPRRKEVTSSFFEKGEKLCSMRSAGGKKTSA